VLRARSARNTVTLHDYRFVMINKLFSDFS